MKSIINRALAAEKKLFTLLLAVAAGIGTMFAEKVKIGDLYYNLDTTSQTAEVTSQYSDYPYWSTTITTANIPASVTYNSVSYSVTSIGRYAFDGCDGLTSVTIPNSVTSIGYSAFSGCSGLTSVIWNAKNCADFALGTTLFYNLRSQITSFTFGNEVEHIPAYLCYGMTNLTSIEIPNSVTSIGWNAFESCTGLTSVTIGNSVTSIGWNAFESCTGLTSLTIPNSVTSIGYSAFSGCWGLTSVTIGNSVTSIGSSAFRSCSGLTSIIVENGNSFYDSRNNCNAIIETATNTLIVGCMNTIIPNSVTSIGYEAFSYCTGLTSVTIPNSVTSIGKYAFYWCTGLTSVTIGNSVTSIGNNAFYGCSGLTSVTIPNSVTSIGEYAFVACTGLTSVTIGNSVTSVGDHAFRNCSGLTSVTIGNSVTSIGAGAFYKCSGLTSVTIPNSVTSIGGSAFLGCSSLTSVTIGNSVTSIGGGAFEDCSSLTSVTIPNSVTSIGQSAFRGCSSLTTIYVTCGDLERVKQLYFNDNRVKYAPLKYHITGNVNIEGAGSVQLPQNECEDVITAIPNYGYHFAQWSDGNTENPRTIVLTQDTTFTAEFAIDRTGTCGDDNALTWTYDTETKTLTITGNGTLNSNYTFGVEAPTQMQKLVIGNEITSIGDSAFYGMSTINHLVIGGSVASIGDYTFAECKNFDDITCFATIVPVINETTFANVGNKQYIYLFVPEARERAYHRDTYWGEFDIQVQQAEGATVTTNDVTVEPQDNAATVTWPTSNNAATYTLQITKDGVVFCTLIFNANGQLTGIAFAPSREGSHHAPQTIMTANGLQFTVTGLDSGTQYGYNVTAKDANDQTVATYSGEFTTTSEGTATGIEEISSSLQGGDRGRLILLNSQIYILRGEKVYTLQGQEVK